jgi:hypothetical protein
LMSFLHLYILPVQKTLCLWKGCMSFWALSLNSTKLFPSNYSIWMGPELGDEENSKLRQECFLTLSLHHKRGHSYDWQVRLVA